MQLESWCNASLKLLTSVGARAAAASAADEVQTLITQIECFLSGSDPQAAGGLVEQERLLVRLSQLTVQVFPSSIYARCRCCSQRCCHLHA